MTDEPLRVFDGIAVLDEPAPLEPRTYVSLSPVVVQRAAVVGASFVAGATAMAVVRRRRVRKFARRRRRVLAPVLASRSFLVDVHMLGERK